MQIKKRKALKILRVWLKNDKEGALPCATMFSIQVAREHQRDSSEEKPYILPTSDKKKTQQWLEMGEVIVVSPPKNSRHHPISQVYPNKTESGTISTKY